MRTVLGIITALLVVVALGCGDDDGKGSAGAGGSGGSAGSADGSVGTGGTGGDSSGTGGSGGDGGVSSAGTGGTGHEAGGGIDGNTAGEGGGGSSGGSSDSQPPMTDCAGGKYDSVSGLCWQNPPPSDQYIWDDAVAYCDSLDLDGHRDWRLPKIQELISLIRGCDRRICEVTDPDCLSYDACCTGYLSCPALQGPGQDGCYWDPELSGKCVPYWSSSFYIDSDDGAWMAYYATGIVGGDDRAWGNSVRCVRDGP